MAPTIYLAGPDVFLATARGVGKRKQELCTAFGFEGLFPFEADAGAAADAKTIFLKNRALMDRADVGVFNLTPFRGPSADAGTVFELGYMAAQGKLVFGYAGTRTPYLDRVEQSQGKLTEREGCRVDRDGYAVEDFGLGDNLMIVRAIEEAGGTLSLVDEDTLAAFRAFEACLASVQDAFRAGRLGKP